MLPREEPQGMLKPFLIRQLIPQNQPGEPDTLCTRGGRCLCQAPSESMFRCTAQQQSSIHPRYGNMSGPELQTQNAEQAHLRVRMRERGVSSRRPLTSGLRRRTSSLPLPTCSTTSRIMPRWLSLRRRTAESSRAQCGLRRQLLRKDEGSQLELISP